MTITDPARQNAQIILDRMFAAEMQCLRSDTPDLAALAGVFHPDVAIREPASLPYAGVWQGLDGAVRLFAAMREAWSGVEVEGMEAVRSGDLIFMTCQLTLTSRATGMVVTQPFAEVLRLNDDLVIEGTPFYSDTAALITALA